MLSLLCWVVYMCFCLVCISKGCVYPTGLDSDPGVPLDGILLAIVAASPGEVNKFETPIQFRLPMLFYIGLYNSMVTFEEQELLDIWQREEESNLRRRCQDTPLFSLHRRVTLAYVVYYGLIYVYPNPMVNERATAIMESFNLDPNICNENEYNCVGDTNTPWGLAYNVVKEIKEYASFDGWNADGSLSREYNKIPYEDFRNDKYIPLNNPWQLKNKKHWQPLLESDNLGFLYYQEHVVPHIGFTGKSFFFTDEDICARQAYNPHYNYDHEIELLLNRLESLTDRQKIEIEYFDSKSGSILPLLIQFFLKQGISLDSFQWIKTFLMSELVLYESTLVVWKEKINWDRIRPPSIIHHKLDGQYITSYAGRDNEGRSFGTQTFLANDFEPYIRTMPHAEYPSASACVCEAFKNAMIEFLGTDDVTDAIGGPLVHEIPAFSSKLEPLSTPQQNLTFEFYSWSQISARCAQSRLDGGMHFTESVPSGQELCANIGTIVAQTIKNITNGLKPNYVIDFNNRQIPNRDCTH